MSSIYYFSCLGVIHFNFIVDSNIIRIVSKDFRTEIFLLVFIKVVMFDDVKVFIHRTHGVVFVEVQKVDEEKNVFVFAYGNYFGNNINHFNEVFFFH